MCLFLGCVGTDIGKCYSVYMQLVAHTLDETEQFATAVLSSLKHSAGKTASVLTLSGPLGAGKTALTKCIAKQLGVHDSVTSPTFILRIDYDTTDEIFSRLVHIDAYRLTPDSVHTIGWDAVINQPGTLVVVEWPEYIAEHIPGSALAVLVSVAEHTHTFSVASSEPI